MNSQSTKHLNILAFGAHPDDIEAGAGGLLVKAQKNGLSTGVVDLSCGEMGTGSRKIRTREAFRASQLLKLDFRECLHFPDTGIINNQKNKHQITDIIRKYKPEIILVPYWEDRHPDHVNASHLISHAIFCSEVDKLTTNHSFHQPQLVLYYMLHHHFEPSFILDITAEFPIKMTVLGTHQSQFGTSKNSHQKTDSKIPPENLEIWTNKAKFYGSSIGVKYGEPYKVKQTLGLKDISSILPNNF